MSAAESRPQPPRLAADLVRARVAAVPDPELPVVTLAELGVIRSVGLAPDGLLEVVVTPTYLGCPAMPVIEAGIRAVLAACGHADGRVRQVLAPPWSTDRISSEGRRKLAEHGIAPPGAVDAPVAVRLGLGARCPHCGSMTTRPQSAFGATRCQAIVFCTACRETFAHLKAM
ncbi:phenylacetate-CoA oxygenase subunit PaaJ [Kitasatospora herbaricolor]|uniref:1,2-phenylacetyl-CoA epoxidase subunit PaaD n=1 Tax=Kitasatospora herbaricolor TaxID=68217 RepID=UPI0019838428|nr:1,2-phenylacetyl-CoA epoxidase subunit PaaD [Kitasatospora herbaricolor]MDQ0306080.1 ring-1,2-phenylacetyl-CoA epoxidase subunit PaaD [Kitasatospora herbaricolor]GGV23457.1 phenylacetate-CoA oxygenase subunit PaaJ [Kitasatospora herbaricolor]